MRQTGDIRIGISAWRYKGWREAFYARKLPQRGELAAAVDIVAEFVYCRLHVKADGKCVGTKLPKMPKRKRRDVYVYFDNDSAVRTPFDAKGLISRVQKEFRR